MKGETLREGSKVPVPKPRRPTLTNKVVRGLDLIADEMALRNAESPVVEIDAGVDYIQKLIAWHDARSSK